MQLTSRAPGESIVPIKLLSQTAIRKGMALHDGVEAARHVAHALHGRLVDARAGRVRARADGGLELREEGQRDGRDAQRRGAREDVDGRVQLLRGRAGAQEPRVAQPRRYDAVVGV